MGDKINVIAVFDIGKTNKKFFLFDKQFDIVYTDSTRFDEIVDDDNYPCDDMESIETWIQESVYNIQKGNEFNIKAINFSTHGASLMYLDKAGKKVTPLYNYLKPLKTEDFKDFYEKYGGIASFSRETASPAYGMLNTGLQIYWLKHSKPHFWEKVDSILHYPQYLSYLFSNKITADYTYLGAHTALWDFDNMQYHNWINKENIVLPEPTNGKQATLTNINGEKVAVGMGIHDSTASLIPILEGNESGKEFILLSTGTWIICMNPFSKEVLTQEQLENDCLCYMTPEKQQVKSSMQFLGRIHEVYLEPLSNHFNVGIDSHMNIGENESLYNEIIDKNESVFLTKGKDEDFEAYPELLKRFDSYEVAYYQLIYEITKKVVAGINHITDKDANLSELHISGGFNRNKVFVKYLLLMIKDIEITISDCKNESALGAALLMKQYL